MPYRRMENIMSGYHVKRLIMIFFERIKLFHVRLSKMLIYKKDIKIIPNIPNFKKILLH